MKKHISFLITVLSVLVFLCGFDVSAQEYKIYLDKAERAYEEENYGSAYSNYEYTTILLKKKFTQSEELTLIYMDALKRLSEIHIRNEDLSDAMDTYKRVVEISEAFYYDTDVELGLAYLDYSNILIKYNKFESAFDYLEKAVKIFQKNSRDSKENIAKTYFLESIIYEYYFNDLDRAKKLISRALELEEKAAGKDHLDVGRMYGEYGFIEFMAGRYEHSKACFENSLRIRKKHLGNEDPETAKAHEELGLILHEMGKTDKSFAELLEAAEVYENSYPGSDPIIAAAMYHGKTVIFVDIQNYEKPVDNMRKEFHIDKDNTNDEKVAKLFGEIGKVYLDKNDGKHAAQSFEKQLQILKKIHTFDHREMALPRLQLARSYALQKEKKLSAEQYMLAVQLFEKFFGPDHAMTIEAKEESPF